MVKIVETRLTDDLDGSPAVESVRFGIDGRNYVIDLSAANARALRAALAKYVEAARPYRPKPARRRSSSPQPDPRAVRKWAAEHGIEVPARGRISEAVLERYRAEHGR